jgi:hypothetical protein
MTVAPNVYQQYLAVDISPSYDAQSRHWIDVTICLLDILVPICYSLNLFVNEYNRVSMNVCRSSSSQSMIYARLFSLVSFIEIERHIRLENLLNSSNTHADVTNINAFVSTSAWALSSSSIRTSNISVDCSTVMLSVSAAVDATYWIVCCCCCCCCYSLDDEIILSLTGYTSFLSSYFIRWLFTRDSSIALVERR